MSDQNKQINKIIIDRITYISENPIYITIDTYSNVITNTKNINLDHLRSNMNSEDDDYRRITRSQTRGLKR